MLEIGRESEESRESGEELRNRVGLPVRGVPKKEEVLEKAIVDKPIEEVKTVETNVVEVVIEEVNELTKPASDTEIEEERISTEELLAYTKEDELSHIEENIKITYELKEKIGEGAFGTVHRAMSSNGEEVAIKILKDFSGLEEEVTILSELDHPNIVAIKEVFDQDGQQGIVMEYVKGKTLADMIKEEGTRIDILDWYAIAQPTLSALTYAHSTEIIHGDIKPSNILIREDGTVKICDFGLSRKLDLNEKMSLSLKTQKGAKDLAGTIAYMAPELYQEVNTQPNKLTDTYSTVMSLYKLLVGRLPEDLDDNPPYCTQAKRAIISKLLKGLKGKSRREKLKNIKKQIHDELLDELHHQIFEIDHSKNPEKEKLKKLVRNNIQAYKPLSGIIDTKLDETLNALSLFTPEEFKELPEITNRWFNYYWGHAAVSGLLKTNERKKALRQLQKFEVYIDETYVSDLLAKIEAEENRVLEEKKKTEAKEYKSKNLEPVFENQLEQILDSFTKLELKILKQDSFSEFLSLRKEYLDTKAMADEELMSEEHIKNYSHILGSTVGTIGIISVACALHFISPIPLEENIELIQGAISGILGTGIVGYIMGHHIGQVGYPKENKNVIDARQRLPELSKKLEQQSRRDYCSTKMIRLTFPPQIIQNGKIQQNPHYDTYISARDKIVQTFMLLATAQKKELEQKEENEQEKTKQGMQKVQTNYQARIVDQQIQVNITRRTV